MSKVIDQKIFEKIIRVRASVHAVAEMIVIENFLPHQRAQAIADLLIEEDKFIRGNRHGESKVTWSDARLMLMATMAACMKFLELSEDNRAS